MLYIGLDIDGVIIKEEDEVDIQDNIIQYDRECLSYLEDILRQYQNWSIIITSSWREMYNLSQIKLLFSEDIRDKIIGVTPIYSDPVPYFRYYEVLEFLKINGLEDQPWLAIDDIKEHYPDTIDIIVTDAYKGFTQESAEKLRYFLVKYTLD